MHTHTHTCICSGFFPRELFLQERRKVEVIVTVTVTITVTDVYTTSMRGLPDDVPNVPEGN